MTARASQCRARETAGCVEADARARASAGDAVLDEGGAILALVDALAALAAELWVRGELECVPVCQEPSNAQKH